MRSIIFVISFIMLNLSVQAQRRLPGQQGLQATVGKVDGFGGKTLHTGAALSRFTKNRNQWTYGVEYLKKELQYRGQFIPIEQFTGEAGYYYTFLSDGSKTFFFSAGLSGMAGYELVNRNISLLDDGSAILSKNKFLIGGVFSFEIETYIVDKVILLTRFRQRVLPGSTVNRFHSQFSLGVKFIIN